MVGRDAVHRPPARRERARPRDADGPAPARPLPGLMTPGAVVALQGGAGNAAIARAVIQRHPAAPAQLHTDPSLVQIKPEPGAADPMAIADVMTSEPEVGARTVEHTRMFGCSSKPTNLIFTWRVFDGADRQTKDQMSGLALVLTNEEVRAWELLRDSQQVRMPDGRVVDVYHLLVGLDVLPRKDENRSISRFPGVNRNVGQNYSAATWSGDIAAAAARRRTSQDASWEKQDPNASESDNVERYYSTRVADGDLYGDIDAWGITDLQRAATGAPTSIDGLQNEFYGGRWSPPTSASEPGCTWRSAGRPWSSSCATTALGSEAAHGRRWWPSRHATTWCARPARTSGSITATASCSGSR